jgi:hypothetical protein
VVPPLLLIGLPGMEVPLAQCRSDQQEAAQGAPQRGDLAILFMRIGSSRFHQLQDAANELSAPGQKTGPVSLIRFCY